MHFASWCQLLNRALLTFGVGLLLVACSDIPAPDQDLVSNIKGTKFLATQVAEPLNVDGCLVNVYRVHTGETSRLPSFTYARAKCDSAETTLVSHSCGKACEQSVVTVQTPSAPASAASSGSKGELSGNDKKLVAMQAQVDQLTKELNDLRASAKR